ncbi:MAG: T9SS type A sorting domain-containing protein [Ferruginibacter sp.]|nr:T9SS type A sorting domain-containing protein [Ferruginibacter sp.]
MKFFYLLGVFQLSVFIPNFSIASNQSSNLSLNSNSLLYNKSCNIVMTEEGKVGQNDVHSNYSSTQYVSINGFVYENGVQLAWVINSASENSYFEVERSFDGNLFNTVGMVLGAESVINDNQTFGFKDNTSKLKKHEIVYYRLKEIGQDEKVSYSTIITVKLTQATGISNVQVSPNPFTNKLTFNLKSSNSQTVDIRFINNAGNTLLNKQIQTSKEVKNYTIAHLNNLPNDIYVVQFVVDNTIICSQKVIKQ